MTGKCLRKTERSEWPGFVIAPDQENDTAQQHGSRQQEPGPERKLPRQGDTSKGELLAVIWARYVAGGTRVFSDN